MMVYFSTVIGFLSVGVAQASVAPEKKSKVIFVPGYYGSKISESVPGNGQSNGDVFLTLSNLIFGSTKLQMSSRLNLPSSLVSAGLLDFVTVLPWIYSIDGYGKTYQRLQQEAEKHGISPSSDMFIFDYDWRLDPISILQSFEAKLTQWKLDPEQHDIHIVAHSMGGWLMSYWLRFGAQEPAHAVEDWSGLRRVKRVMLVAAPFRGTLSVFRNSFWGAPGLPNDTFLGAKVISSFPSTYYLTPNSADFYLPNGELERIDLKNSDLWLKNKWGALQYDSGSVDFVEFHVRQSLAFQNKIHGPLESSSVEILKHYADRRIHVYVGSEHETNELGLEISQSPRRFAFSQKQIRRAARAMGQKMPSVSTNLDGDETVSTASAAAPKYLLVLGAESFTKRAAHLEILREGPHIDWQSFFQKPGTQP